MGRVRGGKKPDRHLSQRAGYYHYKRRVPAPVAALDERAPHVRVSLKTDDLAVARAKRDLLEAADDSLWASLLAGEAGDPARARYQAAVRRVEALGFTFRSAHTLASIGSIEDIAERLEAIFDRKLTGDAERAVIGMTDQPQVSIRDAFDIYVDEIVPDELVNKSAFQKAQWKKVKLRAVSNFVQIVGDKAMTEITRDDAQRIYRHWLHRIVPKDGKATHSASSGNRDLGNLRVLYDAYFKHVGEDDRKNPFAGLSFHTRKKRTRPPFPREWLSDTIMKPGAMATMNDEARAIVLALIETGARPSEICNLVESSIRVDHEVPHLKIEPRDDPDDPREIKTSSSERLVPLIGIALEVFKKHRKGFPRYMNRENDLSAALNKFFRENSLFPTSKHKIYSIRHSFEDRMKEANLDEELRRIMMGHSIDRPRYGAGGSLAWRRDELKRIELPFDPAIV